MIRALSLAFSVYQDIAFAVDAYAVLCVCHSVVYAVEYVASSD